MMKYFEWAKQLPEDECARLLRVYDEIRRQYAARPETDVIKGMISTWLTEPKKQREAREESVERARKWNAISGLILHWCKHHDTTKSLRTLINEHEQRYKSDPEYMGKVDSGELQAFVFDRDYTDDKSEFWYSHISSCYSILNDQYLLFNNTGLYDVNTDMSMIEAFEYARGKVQEFEHKIKRINEYDFETPLRTMEFASSIIKHIEDPSFGYFPELNELKAYLLPSKMADNTIKTRGKKAAYRYRMYEGLPLPDWEQVTGVQAEAEPTAETLPLTNDGLSYRGIAYYLICEGRTINHEKHAEILYDSLSEYSKKSTAPTRGRQLWKEYNTLQERHRFNKTQMKRFVSLINELDEMNILSPEGMEVLNNDREKIGKRL